MKTFEDIVDEILSNGGHSIKPEMYDDTAVISYIDADGNEVQKKYLITINEDGTEDWKEVS